jgi:hypothetical protein
LYFAKEGIKIKAKPAKPMINNCGAPCKCRILNNIASTVIELKTVPEI